MEIYSAEPTPEPYSSKIRPSNPLENGNNEDVPKRSPPTSKNVVISFGSCHQTVPLLPFFKKSRSDECSLMYIVGGFTKMGGQNPPTPQPKILALPPTPTQIVGLHL